MKSRKLLERNHLPLHSDEVEITGDTPLIKGDNIYAKHKISGRWYISDTISSWAGDTPNQLKEMDYIFRFGRKNYLTKQNKSATVST